MTKNTIHFTTNGLVKYLELGTDSFESRPSPLLDIYGFYTEVEEHNFPNPVGI